MSYQVINPFIQFVDPINGKPLSGGSVYFGRQDTDPKNQPANRINVYAVQDNGSEVLLAQPITLNGAGQPQYSGSVKQIKVELYAGESAYAIQVFSSSGSQKGYSSRVYGLAQITDFTAINGVKMLTDYTSGVIVNVKGFYASSTVGGGQFYFDGSVSKSQHNGGTIIAPEAIAAWAGTQADIATLLNWTGSGSGCFVRLLTTSTISANWFGAGGGKAAYLDHLPIQAALDSIGSTLESGGIVTCDAGIEYGIGGLITVKTNQQLNFSGALCEVKSTVTEAFRLGASTLSSSLSYEPELLDFNIVLKGLNTIGVHLLQTQEAVVRGYIEGVVGSTGRNLAVWIDGGDASAFFNEIDVRCNHIYEGFRVKSSGSVHATNQLFINCHVLGDYSYGNTTSIGINFGADSALNEGEGSVVLGGNFEQCGIGMYISANSGPITSIGTRFENDAAAADIVFKGSAVRAHAIVNPVAVKNIIYESPASSLASIINSNGIDGTPSINRKVKGGYQYQDQETFIGTKYGADGTGYILTQAGLGSLTTGAAHVLYAQNHPTKAGSYEINVTVGGDFRVGQNLFSGAGYYFKVASSEVTPVRDNVSKLGSASERWTEVFAANGTINTSDARDKTPVRPFTANELEASKLIAKEFGFFKWLSAVGEKGDSARSHCGTTVQRIIDIMESCDLVPAEYGFICYDEWDALEELRDTVQVDVDEDGTPIMQEVVTRPARPAGNRYSLRDGELMKFIAKGIDARLSALEGK